MPPSVKVIHSGAFTNCRALASVDIPPGKLRGLNNELFRGCVSLTEVELPDSIAVVGRHAFRNCAALRTLRLPATSTSIGAHAFRHCDALVGVHIPSTCTAIGDSAFADCGALAVAVVPQAVQPRTGHRGGWGRTGNLFARCPRLAAVHSDTPRARVRIYRLRFWTASTHRQCTRAQRDVVMAVACCVHRSARGHWSWALPSELWRYVLEHIRPREMGVAQIL